ncbi:MAG: RNA-binding S4 domain-containing protein [Woeseiaceae bacterium]
MSKGSLRLDRWLWFTRFYKTRSAASAAVQGGHVRVNGERARAATRVGVGDEIRLKRLQLEHELTVTGIPLRRGPATEARACYEESLESVARREARVSELRRDRAQMPMTRGKPDKHTRRQLRDRNREPD